MTQVIPLRHHTTSLAVVSLAALVAAAGCSTGPSDGPSRRVRVEMKRLAGGPAAVASRADLAPEAAPGPYPWTSALAISSVRARIQQIALGSADGDRSRNATLYECPGTAPTDCLVEMTGPALQNLLPTEPVPVALGSYDHIRITYCFTTSRPAQLTATASIGGDTYYTRTTGAVVSATGPAEPVTITLSGCVGEFPITPPLEITDTLAATTTVTLFFNLLDVGLMSLTTPALYSHGMCTQAFAPPVPVACIGYPDPIPVIGSTPPTVEHYRINNVATIGLAFDPASGAFVGGYVRRHYVDNVAWTRPGFTPDGIIFSLTDNGDGTYRMNAGGAAIFPAWQRRSHSGTVTADGVTTPYSAELLP